MKTNENEVAFLKWWGSRGEKYNGKLDIQVFAKEVWMESRKELWEGLFKSKEIENA